jgi:flagellar hook-length control protein FliK
LASVSAVTTAEFRSNLIQQPNVMTEGDDPFSLLLNTVTDVKAAVQRPEAPKVAERRDAPVKQPKPEADADRQAKRQSKEAAKPEAGSKPDSSAPANTATASKEDEEIETEGGDTDTAAATLMIALGEAPQQEVVVQAPADAETVSQEALAPVAGTEADSTMPVPVPVAAAETAKSEVSFQPAAAVAAAAAKPKLEVAPGNPFGMQVDAEAEIALPKISAETISSLMKPLKAASLLDTQSQSQAQVQTQPGSVNLAAATPLQGPAQLDMLNAAISKHVQLSLAFEANEAAPEAPKPLIASNAVTPNFAMTAQLNAPVQAQTQQVTEAARAVPLDQLAVEIATRANKGERRFDIRLDPPELGRIDVRLEIDNKGNTTTKLIVERVETLDMLRQDARGLEKALQNAGLKTDAGGMQFSLQQDTQTHQGHQNHAPEMRGGRPDLAADDSEAMKQLSINDTLLAAQLRGGVDIRI